jgi:pyridoxamine 5'-phosphate oxidase
VDFHKLRKDYKLQTLDEAGADANPLTQFARWLAEAVASGIIEPNAMTVATSTKDGKPSARILLLKGYDENGFVFYTNYGSRKGDELAANPQAALLFYWAELERQVRIEGSVEKVSREQSEVYFGTRPRAAQLGACGSPQSRVVAGREELEKGLQEVQQKWGDEKISCPKNWGGYRVKPERFEFWQGRQNRLHDRLLYTPKGKGWKMERLAP